jgi:SPP1 family predicted phage head-tail adaptor
MGVGKFQDVITIRGRGAGVADGYGGVTETYSDKWTGLGLIEKLNGSRAIQAGASALDGTFTMKIRKNPNITFNKRDIIVYEGKNYGIVSIDEVDNDRFLEFVITVTE